MFPGQHIMEILQNQLQEGVEKLQGFQKQQQKALSSRQMLDSQLNENKLVKDEMDKLDGDAKVFKLIGPALVRQVWCTRKLIDLGRIDMLSG